MSGKFRAGLLCPLTLGGLGLIIFGVVLGAQAEPVHFKELLPFVDVKIPGWKMEGKPSGMTLKRTEIQISEARATFRSGEKTLEIIVMDFLGQPMPWMAMAAQLEMETSEEVVRSTTVEGHTAMEVFRTPEKEGELNISVADRFWVKIEGEGIESPQVLQGVAQHLDFKKLEKLAKPTP